MKKIIKILLIIIIPIGLMDCATINRFRYGEDVIILDGNMKMLVTKKQEVNLIEGKYFYRIENKRKFVEFLTDENYEVGQEIKVMR
jgi:hypothetical protein